jgi:hypothetical protein
MSEVCFPRELCNNFTLLLCGRLGYKSTFLYLSLMVVLPFKKCDMPEVQVLNMIEVYVSLTLCLD